METLKKVTEIHYNQNDVEKFIPLDIQANNGADILMIAKGQEQGVVLCLWDRDEYVTWMIYRHDNWKNANHGNYFRFGKGTNYTKDQAFDEAHQDFIRRCKRI